jgi:hypothetical protein
MGTNNRIVLGSEPFGYTNVVGMGMRQDNRVHVFGCGPDLVQRVDNERIVLGPRRVDERDRGPVAQ